LLNVLLVCAFALSASFSIRAVREERRRIRRQQRLLSELIQLRREAEEPAAGLVLAGTSGVSRPGQLLPDDLKTTYLKEGTVSRVTLGAGVDRLTSKIGVTAFPADRLGDLLQTLESGPSGWWVTGLTLEATVEGLQGELTVEALDKSPADD
jgi:hypothetical protein